MCGCDPPVRLGGTGFNVAVPRIPAQPNLIHAPLISAGDTGRNASYVVFIKSFPSEKNEAGFISFFLTVSLMCLSHVVLTDLWFQGRLGLHPAVKMSLSSAYVLTDPLLTPPHPLAVLHATVSQCALPLGSVCLPLGSFHGSHKCADKNQSNFFFFLLFPPTKCFVRVPPHVQIRQNKPPRHSAVSVWRFEGCQLHCFRLVWTFRLCWAGLNLQNEAVLGQRNCGVSSWTVCCLILL